MERTLDILVGAITAQERIEESTGLRATSFPGGGGFVGLRNRPFADPLKCARSPNPASGAFGRYVMTYSSVPKLGSGELLGRVRRMNWVGFKLSVSSVIGGLPLMCRVREGKLSYVE